MGFECEVNQRGWMRQAQKREGRNRMSQVCKKGTVREKKSVCKYMKEQDRDGCGLEKFGKRLCSTLRTYPLDLTQSCVSWGARCVMLIVSLLLAM